MNTETKFNNLYTEEQLTLMFKGAGLTFFPPKKGDVMHIRLPFVLYNETLPYMFPLFFQKQCAIEKTEQTSPYYGNVLYSLYFTEE